MSNFEDDFWNDWTKCPQCKLSDPVRLAASNAWHRQQSKYDALLAEYERLRAREDNSRLMNIRIESQNKELLAQAESMAKALILSRSKISGYVDIANHELDLAELREDLKSAHQINKNALEAWQKFKEQK